MVHRGLLGKPAEMIDAANSAMKEFVEGCKSVDTGESGLEMRVYNIKRLYVGVSARAVICCTTNVLVVFIPKWVSSAVLLSVTNSLDKAVDEIECQQWMNDDYDRNEFHLWGGEAAYKFWLKHESLIRQQAYEGCVLPDN